MKKTAARARRQRIPAFGEWNYAFDDDDWPVTQYFESGMQTMQAGGRLVMAIPIPPSPPPKPANKVVKWKESATPTFEFELEDDDGDGEKHQRVVGLGDHGGGAVKKQGKQQSPVVVAHAYKASRAAAVVKAMDQDLYHIPPDMLCHEPRNRLTRRRSLWMGCLGLDCVA